MRGPLRPALPALLLAFSFAFALAAPASAQVPAEEAAVEAWGQTRAAADTAELPLDTWVTGGLTAAGVQVYRLPAGFDGWVEIVLESRDFDALLRWTATRDGIVVDEAMNDDAEGLAGGGDSRLRVEVGAGTEGLIEASSYYGAREGEFRIRASAIESPPLPAPPTPIRYGDDVTGALTDRDWDPGYGARERSYTFEGNAGDEVWITLESDQFDALLKVYFDSQVMAVDDDGLQGTNSLVERVLEESGTYRVVVGSLDGAPGEYRLRLGEGFDLPRPNPEAERRASAGRVVYLTQYGVMVPAEDAPAELAFTEEERAPLLDDGSRLGSPALGFSLPSPDWSGVSFPPQDRVLALIDLTQALAGPESGDEPILPVNVEIWRRVDEESETALVVVAARSDVPVDAEAMARVGSRMLMSIGLSMAWMDIQWDESRSVAYRVTPDRRAEEGVIGAMRCRTGPARDRGGLIVCALGASAGRAQEMEAWLEGLEVR